MLLRNGSMGAGISNNSKLAAGERGLLVLLFYFFFNLVLQGAQAAELNRSSCLGVFMA